jgi:hypothetical protein
MEYRRPQSLPDINAARLAIRKALMDGRSRWGESRRELEKILRYHFESARRSRLQRKGSALQPSEEPSEAI